MIVKKSPEAIEAMAVSGRALYDVFAELEQHIVPGAVLSDLDAIAEKLIRQQGAVPSFLGYRGFPASICASPNEVIVHGIPNGRRVTESDILSVDIGLILGGWHADRARTYPIGDISPEATRLLEATRASLDAAFAACRAGSRLGDIGHAVETIAEREGLSVAREYSGHGIGRSMHEDPQVPNHGDAGRGMILEEGMVFALEPMINAGGWRSQVLDDGWTVVTADGTLSAHFEDTVAVTANGPRVLTGPAG